MKRNTIQRELTLNAVKKLKNHPSAEEIYHEVIKLHPTISRATVYRNLNQLKESGVINEVKITDGPIRYDYRYDKHYHFKCVKCGKIEDVEMDYLGILEDKIKNMDGKSIQELDLVFKGMCIDCLKKNK